MREHEFLMAPIKEQERNDEASIKRGTEIHESLKHALDFVRSFGGPEMDREYQIAP